MTCCWTAWKYSRTPSRPTHKVCFLQKSRGRGAGIHPGPAFSCLPRSPCSSCLPRSPRSPCSSQRCLFVGKAPATPHVSREPGHLSADVVGSLLVRREGSGDAAGLQRTRGNPGAANSATPPRAGPFSAARSSSARSGACRWSAGSGPARPRRSRSTGPWSWLR